MGFFTGAALQAGLVASEAAFVATIKQRVSEFADDLLLYAQDNAPWEDDTGDARYGLETDVDWGLTEATIVLYHTVDYGLWLEVRWNGRYAIILPSIEAMGPELMSRLEGSL